MKIVFICGSIEPGKDGVGDYVRRMSEELIRRGIEVKMLALNDRLIDDEFVGEQMLNGMGVGVMRLPSVWKDRKRYNHAKAFIEGFNPDWVSFQFVPYSFQDRGLPFSLKSFIKMVGRKSKWHIMFHELWLGFSINSTIKEKIIGFMQRNLILTLTKYIRPRLTTTTNSLYGDLLRNNYVRAKMLPLFSNIEVAEPDENYTRAVLEKLDIRAEERHSWRIIGVFGNIYPDSHLENAIEEQLQLAEPKNIKIAILGFGNLHESGQAEFKRLQNIFGHRIKSAHLGIQPGNRISNTMQVLDYGISCTPAEHIGKSGVFATMRLHGLQVILPKDGTNREMDELTGKYIHYHMNRPSKSWNVSYIADQYMKMLDESGVKAETSEVI
jgi:hypothetical protein